MGKEIELPDWLEQLRRSEIVARVKDDPRSTEETRLGVSDYEARNYVTEWGQADFDSPCRVLSPERDLSPDDRVLLYAYFQQLGHWEELIAAFCQIFANALPEKEPIVVDLGCGPFTGGFAIASVLDSKGRKPQFDYIGVDRSRAMREFGERLAAAVEQLSEVNRHWSPDISSISWNSAPGWRPVIVIVSYLLASPTLNAAALIAELDKLLEKLGGGSVTVLYTNSPRARANRSFPVFCKALNDAGFKLYADDVGEIEIERRSGKRSRELRYALFRRPEQRTINLERS